MTISRRHIVIGATGILAGCAHHPPLRKAKTMYGLIGKMRAVPGQRHALATILIEGISGMPGCLSYIVANDPADAETIWITEVWESKDAHQASLALPSVQDAIRKGRPLIASMESVAETSPVGGQGLPATQ